MRATIARARLAGGGRAAGDHGRRRGVVRGPAAARELRVALACVRVRYHPDVERRQGRRVGGCGNAACAAVWRRGRPRRCAAVGGSDGAVGPYAETARSCDLRWRSPCGLRWRSRGGESVSDFYQFPQRGPYDGSGQYVSDARYSGYCGFAYSPHTPTRDLHGPPARTSCRQPVPVCGGCPRNAMP